MVGIDASVTEPPYPPGGPRAPSYTVRNPAGSGVPRTGALVLRVTHAGRARDVVFAVRVPQPVDAPPDLTEYAQLRSMLAWWRDTLAGRPPEGTYPLAMRLAIYAFGAVPVEVAAARFREDGRDRIPAAKVISRR